jgi:Fe-S-cluster-containing dehydrogenase component
MAEQTYLIIDLDRCWGCKSCKVACEMEHGLAAGDGCVDVVRIEGLDSQGKLHCDYVPVLCQHCADPACLKACPVGAIIRDAQGLVLIDAQLCMGCGNCAKSWPLRGRGLTARNEMRKAVKCNLCRERRSNGFAASCEQHCHRPGR